MDPEEQSKNGDIPPSISEIILSMTNPLASTTKVKNSQEQTKERPVGPTSKYEFLRLVPRDSEKIGSRKRMWRDVDVDMDSDHTKSSQAMDGAKVVEPKLSPQHPSFVKELQRPHIQPPIYMRNPENSTNQGRCKKMKKIVDISSNHLKASTIWVMERAKQIEANLPREHPSFIQVMKPAHVTRHFIMYIPQQFCKSYLPNCDTTELVLEDDNGQKYRTKFIAKSSALSGGWMKFSKAKKLCEDDVLVFHLTEPHKFKVYIVRISDWNGAVDKPSVMPNSKEIKTGRTSRNFKDHPRVVPSNISSQAMDRAKVIEAKLSKENPSFIRKMERSHVGPPFWMKLPRQFCKSHLPIFEATQLVLEDESGQQYKTKYIADRGALSGGWRNFSQAKNLCENDVLIFQLVEPRKFKVYIMRTSDQDAVDKASMVPNSREINFERGRTSRNSKYRPKFVPSNVSQEYLVEDNRIVADLHLSLHNKNVDLSEIDSNFENFEITVDDQPITSEIPDDVKLCYFDLCHSQGSYLHNHLIKGFSNTFAASIISETVNVANTIIESDITTPPEDIANLDMALQGFELLGMNVGFLRTRLVRLLGFALEYREAIDSEEYKEAKTESARIEEEIKEHESKIEELKILKRMVDLRTTASLTIEKCKVKYKEEAKAPW